jgi:WD40 repeat protein
MLWDLDTGEVILRFIGHERGVWGMDIHPEGRYVVSSSEDSTVILWDLETGEALQRFEGHTAWVPDVVFAPDGRTVYSVSMDGTLIQWQAADQPLETMLGWIDANRYVRELTCDERAHYRVDPPCSGD